jgi:ABC-type transport system involved in multi-copper enzyme maturation permease subunit
MIPARLVPLARKELRALGPTWLACAIAIGAAGGLNARAYDDAALLACALGTISLGALSVGHEYTNRTLGRLLALPVTRRQIYLVKLIILAAAVITLTVLAWWLLFDEPHSFHVQDFRRRIPWVAGLLGLLVAPALTMLCRGPLAAVVFTAALPGVLGIVGIFGGTAWYGLVDVGAVDRLRSVLFWSGLVVGWMAGAMGSWRLFMQLEAIDVRDATVGLPDWLRLGARAITDSAPRRQHPLWALFKKEFRLQQLTFIVLAIYAVVLATLTFRSRGGSAFAADAMVPLSLAYLMLGGILIGSLASAEERHFGMIEPQILLPVRAWQQWLLKCAVVVALSLLLSFLTTEVLVSLGGLSRIQTMRGPGFGLIGIVLMLTVLSLYVSSLSTSGVKAMATSLPVGLAAMMLGHLVMLTIASSRYRWVDYRLVAHQSSSAQLARTQIVAYQHTLDNVFTGMAAGLALLLLVFGYVNHRSVERGFRRLTPQATTIGAYVVVCLVLMALLTSVPITRFR